jgi:GNAT superfamily N-acetyltransferase
MDGHEVEVLQLDAVVEAAGVVARAFHDDELTVHLYPDAGERARLTPSMFAALVRYHCLYGRVDHLPGVAAVAVWRPPDAAVETPEMVAAAGFDDLPPEVPLERLSAFFSAIEPWHEQAAPEPHWYLDLLGVEPSRQGVGLGSRLLAHGLDRADASGRPTFLWTFSPRNVPFYVRHGFEVVVDRQEPASRLRCWGFYRAAPKS